MKIKKGFGKVDNSIIFDTSLTPEARFVYTCLACHADKKRECYPSIDTLLRETGMSKTTLYKHLKQLTDRGIVEKIQKKNGNLYSGIIYRLKDFDVS